MLFAAKSFFLGKGGHAAKLGLKLLGSFDFYFKFLAHLYQLNSISNISKKFYLRPMITQEQITAFGERQQALRRSL